MELSHPILISLSWIIPLNSGNWNDYHYQLKLDYRSKLWKWKSGLLEISGSGRKWINLNLIFFFLMQMTNGISTTTNKTSSYRTSLNSNNTTNNKSGSVVGTNNRVVSTVNPLEESTTINRTSSVIRKLPQYQVTETKTTTTVTSNRNSSGLPATSVRALAQKFITTGEEKRY